MACVRIADLREDGAQVRSERITYDIASAAEATGVSIDVIRRAIRAGDLATTSPRINGRKISKPLIPAAELERWALDRDA